MARAWLEPLDDDCVSAVLAFANGLSAPACAATCRGGRAAVAALDDGVWGGIVRHHFGAALWRRASAPHACASWARLWRSLTRRSCDCGCGLAVAPCHPLQLSTTATDHARSFDAVRCRAKARFDGDAAWAHAPLRKHPRALMAVESWTRTVRGAPTAALHLTFDFSAARVEGAGVVGAAGTVRWFSAVGPWQLSLALNPQTTSARGEPSRWPVVDVWLAKFEERRGAAATTASSDAETTALRLGSYYDAGYADFYPKQPKTGRRVAPLDELRSYARDPRRFRETAAARLAELRYRVDDASGGNAAALARIDAMATAADGRGDAFHAALVGALRVCCPDALPG